MLRDQTYSCRISIRRDHEKVKSLIFLFSNKPRITCFRDSDLLMGEWQMKERCLANKIYMACAYIINHGNLTAMSKEKMGISTYC